MKPTPTRVSPYAILTNGIGNKSDYHINRTRSLADPPPPSEAKARSKARVAEGKAGISKPPYAGKPE